MKHADDNNYQHCCYYIIVIISCSTTRSIGVWLIQSGCGVCALEHMLDPMAQSIHVIFGPPSPPPGPSGHAQRRRHPPVFIDSLATRRLELNMKDHVYHLDWSARPSKFIQNLFSGLQAPASTSFSFPVETECSLSSSFPFTAGTCCIQQNTQQLPC